jgi:dipeptidyl aminopeptidase/acylaminoacyl peptidase
LLDDAVRQAFGVVSDACELLECPRGAHYVLSLDDAVAPQVYGDRWRLPSLYLTGQPRGQVARAAWLQAFELWMVEALAQSRAGGGVQERALYQRLVLRLQAQLGLVELPALDGTALAQAFADSEGYSLQYLWEAKYVPGDVQGNLLLTAKVDAFLHWVEEQVGPERTIELLLALRNYRNANVALRSLYLGPSVNLERDWLAHLQNVTGLMSLPWPAPEEPYQALPEPSPPGPPASLPGEQLAFICDGRVWLSNADGSGLVPLTAAGQVFEYLEWSPDGRWLLTVWQYSAWDSALYLLASDGSGGRLLTDQPTQRIYPVGWSPDSSQALYAVSSPDGGTDMRATQLDGGDTRLLFNQPLWSPDGQWSASVQLPDSEQVGVWLYGADGANSRKIVDQATLGGQTWSPDGSQLALTLAGAGPTQGSVALYDLASGDLSPLLTVAEVTEIISPSHPSAWGRDLVGGGVNPSTLDYFLLGSLWSQGWSADGSRLAVRAQSAVPMLVGSPASLLVAPLDGSSPRVLALSQGACVLNRAIWSPTDPNLLLFNWPSAASSDVCHTYLFDLEAGPVYTATQEQVAAWSPDGERVALARNSVSILDKEGRALANLGDGQCSAVAWNPRANLNAPTRILTLSLGRVEADWSFENVRVYLGQDHTLHVWGEVFNHSGSAGRINSLLPLFIENGDGRSFAVEPSFVKPPYQEMFNSVSLEDGQGLPFNFELYLPDDAHLVGAAQLVLQLDLNTNDQEPNRDDLYISNEGLELSGELDSLRVSGSWENPGPALDHSAVIVATVYDRDGHVLGWGWQSQTASYQLAAGRHDVAVDIALADLTDRGQLYSYKVQLLAR